MMKDRIILSIEMCNPLKWPRWYSEIVFGEK